ncbi:PREDICTED: uncharacterized protein LOC109480629 isoform X1 [Branchiostoma belcheri]|uniref:Uncharacterized protein LOC109480629 isoform X1 n=1 Tax=Branchiostoma belcheri TaxID=7741 RepID=A0A6P4ZWN7_BRABE|nr:PREDICTED: uncharacterized protein LOC109480629 isoform X1 [Branchiostoma belcheri]
MREEKGSQSVCLKKPKLIIASKKRDEKQKASTNRNQGFLVQIRGDSSSSQGHHETPPNTKTPKKASIQTWSQKTSFLIALLVQLYAFLKSWIHKEKPPDVKSCKTDTAGIVLEHDVQVYHMHADEDQDTCTPPDSANHGDDQQADDHNPPEWLVQEDVDDDDIYLGTDNPTDHSTPSTTVTADPCTEGPEGGQIAIACSWSLSRKYWSRVTTCWWSLLPSSPYSTKTRCTSNVAFHMCPGDRTCTLQRDRKRNICHSAGLWRAGLG